MMATPIVQLKLMVLGAFISCAITPLSAGFYENFKKVEQGEPASVNNLFTHYNSPYTARLLTYATLFTVATSLFSLLVNLLGLPILSTLFNIFASLLLTFAVPIIIFENQSVEQAVRGSVERVMRNFGTVFLSGLVGGIIAVLGVLLFGIGLIFSLPFCLLLSMRFMPKKEELLQITIIIYEKTNVFRALSYGLSIVEQLQRIATSIE